MKPSVVLRKEYKCTERFRKGPLNDGNFIFTTCMRYLKVNIGAGIHLHELAFLRSVGTSAPRYQQTKSINQNERPAANVIAATVASVAAETRGVE